MKRFLSLCSLLIVLALAQGCAIYGTASDERLTDTMSSDKAVSTLTKKNLMADSMSVGWDIAVYCYYGHVFLVGECPSDQRDKAVSIAKKDSRVRSVTTHWFKKKSGDSDIVLATKLRSQLIGTAGLNNTRIDTVVNSNRVVLLGVATDENERKLAVKAAREVKYVDTVTSYIMLPQRAGLDTRPTGTTYTGFSPKHPWSANKDANAASEPEVDYGDQNVPDLTPHQDLNRSHGGIGSSDI